MGIRGARREPLARAAVAGLVVVLVVLAACSRTSELPELEERAQSINRVVMCPVCPGESIDQSQNPLALQMRDIVADKLNEGWSNDDIYDFFVERYGPRVLLDPPSDGVNLVVWLVPPIGVLVAAGMLFFVIRLMVRPNLGRSDETDSEATLTEEERERYFRRVEAALSVDGPAVSSGDRDGEEGAKC
jgi:cytochrome c-type biogenesis protein CcmH